MGNSKQVILHLSDLHFGCDKSDSERALRELALNGLSSAVRKLEPEWQPTIVCISGDIAYRGRAAEYKEAAAWLVKLLKELNVPADHVLICPGNHDLDRNKVTYDRPKDGVEADNALAVPLDPKYETPFESFAEFAKNFPVQTVLLGKACSYLVGQRVLEGISFLSLNSAWFCRDNSDKEHLWLGRPFIDVLEQNGQVLHPNRLAASQPTVCLLHHPKDWFHDSEVHARDGRANTFDVLAERCHLILTGHTHGESRRPDRIAGAAYMMTGGATYDSGTYNNAFTVIRVGEDRFTFRTYEFDPRSASREWRQSIEATELPFRDSVVQGGTGVITRFVPALDDYRVATQRFAQAIIDGKSRALRPRGSLPKTIPAFVSLEVNRSRTRQDRPDTAVQQVHTPRPITLIDASRSARRTLLLGDLGSGKSTLAATFVIASQSLTQDSIALFVPAKLLAPTSKIGNVSWSSVKEFLASISAFINNHVLPSGNNFDLFALLDSEHEVAIAIDGLDEVTPAVAREILAHLADVVDHWATVQVMATGRPVELGTLDYGRWQLCTPFPVQDDDKLQLFIEEALADGNAEDSALSIATDAIERLRAIPELHLIADTPLFCRLIFDELRRQDLENIQTLGDLLYGILGKRLGDWAVQDNKASVTPQFDREYPDTGSRVKLLSSLTASFDRNSVVPVERARRQLEMLLPDISGISKPQLVDQALRSFESAGLVSLDGGNFELTLHSFDDFCRGYALAEEVLGGRTELRSLNPSEWRTVSFAATMFRRLGVMNEARASLCENLQATLTTSNEVAASAYIVAESQDSPFAGFFVQRLSQLGHRPLSFSLDSPTWPQTAQAMAEGIRLAGDEGFNWFFGEYIDPRYPFVFQGSQLTVEVFLRWAALHIGRLTERQQTALKSLIVPHISADSHQASQVIPALAVLLPEAFDSQTRVKHCVRMLEIPSFHDAAEKLIRKDFESGDQNAVLQIFATAILGGDAPRNAPLLYLTLQQGRPDPRIIRAILTAPRGRKPERQRTRTLEKLKQVLGEECFLRYCRWHLFGSDTMLSAGAAIALFDSGERRIALLGSTFLKALHDGGYVPRAEDILAELMAQDQHSAVDTLVGYIVNSRYEGHGGHSGWWRLLFQFIHDPALNGPDLLVDCLRGVGEFLLPRYPEVRSSFRDLVLGSSSDEYRAVLHSALNHAQPEIRHGAAMVLVASDPATEANALETVVAWKSRRFHGAWWEWERFCLTLRFGPPVLSYLQSRLSTLSGESRIFALAILFQNNVELDEQKFQELISGSLTTVFGGELLGAVFHSDRIRKALLKAVDEGLEEPARKAAEILIGQVAGSLDEEHLVRCKALALDSGAWRSPEFAWELERLRQDAHYAALMTKESEQLVKRGFKRPMIDQIYEAQQNPALWEDIVWNEICSTPPMFRLESRGQWILDFLIKSPANKEAIGEAARKFLFDPRITQGMNTDEPRAWLALLAHEADKLSQDELANVVDEIDPIDKSAYVALVTRLGRPPKDGGRRRRYYAPPEDPKNEVSAETATLALFLEYARPAGVLHPNFCSLIEQSLFNEPFSESELQTLSLTSPHGAVVAGALAAAYGTLPSPDWALTVLGQRAPGGYQNQHCMITLLSLWRILLFVAKSDTGWRFKYLLRLKDVVSAEGPNLCAVASELLSLDHSLSPEHLNIVLRHVAQSTFDDHELYPRLSEWLADGAPKETLDQAASLVNSVLAELDLQPWDIDEGHPKDAGAYLMFPLLHWRIEGATDIVSRRVFLRGLKMALMPPRTRDHQLSGLPNRFVGIEDVGPLLSKMDKSLLMETIQYGTTLDDKELRALCRLFIFDIQEHEA